MILPHPPLLPPVNTIETERLSIRIDTEEQFINAFRTMSDEELKAYFGISSDEMLQKQKEKVAGGLSTYRTSVVFFHLIERSVGAVIGGFAFHNWFPNDQRSEIGYHMTDDAFKGKGYMREAAAPLIAFGFEAMKLNRIEAFIHPENTPSKRLVERLGFTQEGWLRERYCYDGVISDALVYGLLKSEFIASQQPGTGAMAFSSPA